jgi:hypothetical protein
LDYRHEFNQTREALDELRKKCRRVAAGLRGGSRGGMAFRAARTMRLAASILTRAAL